MLKMLKRLVKDEDGATAVEYGILVGLIAAGVIVGASTLGTNVAAAFGHLNDTMGQNANLH